MRKTFWILLEQNSEGKYSPLTNPRHKNMCMWWDTEDEAVTFYNDWDKRYWDNHKVLEPKSPLNEYNRPWRSYVAHVKNIPNSKRLNDNFLKKHMIGLKEILLNEPKEVPKPLADGYVDSDGYVSLDGYSDEEEKKFLY